MPPFFVERNIGIQKFKHDPSLSEEEIAKVAKWVDSGAPRGNPSEMPAPRQFDTTDKWTIGEPDLLHIEIAAMSVDQRVASLSDRGGDRRMVVAERGAHLAGVEVEPALAGDVLDLGTLARHEHRTGDLAPLGLGVHSRSKAVAAGAREQFGFAVHSQSP